MNCMGRLSFIIGSLILFKCFIVTANKSKNTTHILIQKYGMFESAHAPLDVTKYYRF